MQGVETRRPDITKTTYVSLSATLFFAIGRKRRAWSILIRKSNQEVIIILCPQLIYVCIVRVWRLGRERERNKILLLIKAKRKEKNEKMRK